MLTKDANVVLSEFNKYFTKPIKVVVKKNKLFKKITKGFIVSIMSTIKIDSDRTLVNTATVVHEIQHYMDRCIYKDGIFKHSYLKSIWWYFKYMMPQSLVLLVFLSFISWWFMLALIFLIPNPYIFKFRKNAELRGYYWTWLLGDFKLDYRDIFCSMKYLKMDVDNSNKYYEVIFSETKRYMSINKHDNMYNIYIILKNIIDRINNTY